VKIGSVVSDIGGKTARLILGQLSQGNYVPEQLVKLAQASLKNKRAELTAFTERVLHGAVPLAAGRVVRGTDAPRPQAGANR
jgi:hypothetical protein